MVETTEIAPPDAAMFRTNVAPLMYSSPGVAIDIAPPATFAEFPTNDALPATLKVSLLIEHNPPETSQIDAGANWKTIHENDVI
ncbi:MAG: hypothetical protein ABJZ69_06290 [Hyphomicrobiales bacterium]